MTDNLPDNNPKPVRKPRLKLPFEGRKQDAGTWTYDHRIGLCVTLIAYLVLMIAFVSSKIIVGAKPHTQGMFIDLQSLAALQQERDRLEEQVREKQKQEEQIDWRNIHNKVSNENAELEKILQAERGNGGSQDDAAQAHADGSIGAADAGMRARMRANRDAYEKGLAEERAIRERRGTADGEERRDRKVKGRVTVSFSLSNPVRTSRHLEVPAYQCEGGGEVVVEVTVDRSGKVIGTRVASGGDDCMRDSAVRAARMSVFNIDNSAPAKQVGIITYIFIPQ